MGIAAAYTSERLYAEWFSWVVNAMPGLGRETYHHAAQAALTAARTGEDPQTAALGAAHADAYASWSAVSDAGTRAYAEWYEWARHAVGGTPEQAHAAATAASARAQNGQPVEASMEAARQAAELVLRPAPLLELPRARPQPAGPSEYSLGLARDPLRVALLMTFAYFPYYLWFVWQVFALARQERFQRVRSYAWMAVPIYNLVVLYRILDDLKRAEGRLRGDSRLIPAVIIALVVGSSFLANIGSRLASEPATLLFFWAAAGLAALGGYMVQSSVSRYLEGHDRPGFWGNISAGEIVAAVIGLMATLLLTASVMVLTVAPQGR